MEGAGFKQGFGVFQWFLPQRVQRLSKMKWRVRRGATEERRTNCKKEKSNRKTNVIFFTVCVNVVFGLAARVHEQKQIRAVLRMKK